MSGHRAPDALEIAPEALTSAVAATLIAALNVELSARYPEPGANHFRLDPGEVAPVLETGIRQPEALALYRDAGFTDIPAYGEYVASSGTSVCLAKGL